MRTLRTLCIISVVALAIAAPSAMAQRPASRPDTVMTRTIDDSVVVRARRSYSAASDAEFRAADFDLRPRSSAQDILRVVPGLVIAQHAGGGKAEQIFLRG